MVKRRISDVETKHKKFKQTSYRISYDVSEDDGYFFCVTELAIGYGTSIIHAVNDCHTKLICELEYIYYNGGNLLHTNDSVDIVDTIDITYDKIIEYHDSISLKNYVYYH